MLFSSLATLFALVAIGSGAPVQESRRLSVRQANGPVVKGRYIVKLKSSVNAAVHIDSLPFAFSVADSNSPITQSYSSDFFSGYAGDFSKTDLDAILASPDVDFVEEDAIFYALDQQKNAPWSLQSISSQTPVGGSDTNRMDYTYSYTEPAGAGVDIYIIDTGVYAEHEEFGGRASIGFAANNLPKQDGAGHGTHCAGSAAGKTFGVAKNSNIIGVKVLADNGSGSTSDIVAGLQYMVQNAKSTGRPSVGSMSLGGGTSQALDDAVRTTIAAGIQMIVAAGNSGVDASAQSPARVPEAITVGAVDIGNVKAGFSNFGSLVDIFAPGVNITSAWIGAPDAKNKISGTSMATPHVAGLAAYLLSKEPTLTPAALTSKLLGLGTQNVITGLPSGTVNLLAYNGEGGASAPVAIPSQTTTPTDKNSCPAWWQDCFWKDWFKKSL